MSDKKFAQTKDYYDLSSFSGRFYHFVEMTSPLTLIYSNDQIVQAQNILKQCKNNSLNCGTENEMRHYQRLVDSAIHPVNNEIIPKLFRVSAIAPVNIPIVFGMLACPSSNIPLTLTLHIVNQSYNTACNYYNRSGANQSVFQTILAYSLAVSSACTFAYGLGRYVNSENSPKVLRKFGILIPCLATAAANCSNLGFTRAEEIVNGTTVRDYNGNEYGKSRLAGIKGVIQTAITRCVLVPCACLLLPPMIMSSLKTMKFLPRSSTGLMLAEMSIIYLSLQLALPAALALYPQTAIFPVYTLESNFHLLKDKNGNNIDVLYANKGL